MVRLKIDGIVATAEAALAAKRGTRDIPIVAAAPADAVAMGLVASLARSGGNVTGMSYLGTELVGNRILVDIEGQLGVHPLDGNWSFEGDSIRAIVVYYVELIG